jgi:hypothetical protein
MADEQTLWGLCGFCGQEITPAGYDPCDVSVMSQTEAYGWSFGAHAICVRDALHPTFRDDPDIGPSYEYPPKD